MWQVRINKDLGLLTEIFSGPQGDLTLWVTCMYID